MQINKFKFIKKNANAKINLGLQVLQKRYDGYHNINTVFYPIKLSDKIEIFESGEFELFGCDNLNCKTEDNLVFKAWKLINENYKINPVKINLNKYIPSGAGLGGGSSDAAKVILILDELFSLNLDDVTKNELAARLGSDVPYFLNSYKTASGTSKGEILNYFDFSHRFNLLLVNPGINVSTATAYKLLKRDENKREAIDFKSILINEEIKNYKKYIINDFEEVVFQLHPEIASIKEKLYEYGSFFALMSGSGSSVFGFFDDEKTALDAKKRFDGYFTYIE